MSLRPTFIRRALADGLTAELLQTRDAVDRLVAVIHTHAPPDWERSPGPHGEVITLRNGQLRPLHRPDADEHQSRGPYVRKPA